MLKSANASQSYLKNKSGLIFEMRYVVYHLPLPGTANILLFVCYWLPTNGYTRLHSFIANFFK